MSQIPNSGDTSRRLPIGGGDVIVLLVLMVGSLRFIAALVRPFVADFDVTDETGTLTRVVTVLLMLAMHTAVMVGFVYAFVEPPVSPASGCGLGDGAGV